MRKPDQWAGLGTSWPSYFASNAFIASSNSLRSGRGCDCLEALEAICEPLGRELKYSSSPFWLSKFVKKQNPRSSKRRINTIRTFGMPSLSTDAMDIALGSLGSASTAKFNHSLNKTNGFSGVWSLFLNPVVSSFIKQPC